MHLIQFVIVTREWCRLRADKILIWNVSDSSPTYLSIQRCVPVSVYLCTHTHYSTYLDIDRVVVFVVVILVLLYAGMRKNVLILLIQFFFLSIQLIIQLHNNFIIRVDVCVYVALYIPTYFEHLIILTLSALLRIPT